MPEGQQARSDGARVRTIRMHHSVRDAIRILSQPDVDAVIVVDGEREDSGGFIGILTEREIFRAMADQGLDVLDHLVWTLTTGEFASVDIQATPADRLQAFCAHKVNHLAIMDGLCLHAVESIWDCVAQGSGGAMSSGAPVDEAYGRS